MPHISKVYSPLIRRILGVLIVLVIIPLSLDALFLDKRDKKMKETVAQSQLDLMVKSFAIALKGWIGQSRELLQEDLVPIPGTAQYLFDANLVCRASTIEEIVGMGCFFPTYLKEVAQTGAGLFIGYNPYTDMDEIFIFERQGELLRGLSTSKDHLLQRVESLRPFVFDLVATDAIDSKGLRVTEPFAGSNFALSVCITEQSIAQLEGANIYHHFFILIGTILIIGGLGTLWLVAKMARPLGQLATVMEAVSGQDTTRRYRADPFGFEINALGRRFNHMLDALLRHMEAAKNERASKERLSRELEIGLAIQLQLLPKELPDFPGVFIAGRFVPAKEVAGDFYDLYPHPKGGLFLSMADGSDKGISACLYSLIVRSMLRAHVKSGSCLSEIVKLTNNLFCFDTQDSGNFVTAWMGIFDVESGRLTYASSGHLPAVWIHPDGHIEELSTAGVALGVIELAHVEVKSVTLERGGQLFLYTDGVLDAQSKKGEPFGKGRLFGYLNSVRDHGPEALVAGLLDEIETFTSGSEPYDDLTVLSIQRV